MIYKVLIILGMTKTNVIFFKIFLQFSEFFLKSIHFVNSKNIWTVKFQFFCNQIVIIQWDKRILKQLTLSDNGTIETHFWIIFFVFPKTLSTRSSKKEGENYFLSSHLTSVSFQF